MKKYLKIIIVSFTVIIILYFVGFLAPYNLNGIFKANSFGILNINSFRDIDKLSEYFKGYDVNEVKYLGNDSYEVFTDKGDFIVIADYSNTSYWNYKIFKYDKELQYFVGNM